jgi:hypothetical protein
MLSKIAMVHVEMRSAASLMPPMGAEGACRVARVEWSSQFLAHRFTVSFPQAKDVCEPLMSETIAECG